MSLNSTKNFLVIIINAKFRMAQQSNFFRTDMNRQSFHIIVRQVTNFYEEFKMKKNSGSSGMKLSVCNMKVSNMEESVREGLLCKTLHDADVRWITLFLVGLNSLYSNMYTCT